MKRLLLLTCLIALFPTLSHAQFGNIGPVWVVGSAAPASCSGVQLFFNTTNGQVASCQAGTFVTFSAGTGASITGSPVANQLAIFSAANSITNGNLSGDCTTSGALASTCLKTNGVAFVASATTDTTNAANISSGTLPIARLPVVPIANGGSGQTTAQAAINSLIGTGTTGQCVLWLPAGWGTAPCPSTTLFQTWTDVTSAAIGGVADGQVTYGSITSGNTFFTASVGGKFSPSDNGKTVSIDGAGVAAPTFNPGSGGSALSVSTETIASFSTANGIPCNTTGPGSDTLVIALTAITENAGTGMVTSESPPSNYQLTNAINVTSASCTGLNGVVKITPPTVMPTGATGYSVYVGTIGLNGTAPACATVAVGGACPAQILSDPFILSNWARQSKYIGPYIRQPVCLLGSSSTVVNPICFNQSTLDDPTTSSLGGSYNNTFTLACRTLSTTGYGCAPTSVAYLYADGQFDAQPPSSSVLVTTITSVSGNTVNITDSAKQTNAANAQVSWGTDNGALIAAFLATSTCTSAAIGTAGCEIRFPPAAACYYMNNAIYTRGAGLNVGGSNRVKLIGYGHAVGTGNSPSTICGAGRFPLVKWGIQTKNGGSTIGGGAYTLGWKDTSGAGGAGSPGCTVSATVSCGNVPAAMETYGVQSMDFDKNQCASFGVGGCFWAHGANTQLADRTSYGDFSCVSAQGGCAFGFYGPDNQTDSRIGPGMENNVGNSPLSGALVPYSWGKAGIYLGNDPFTGLSTSGFFVTNIRSGSSPYGVVIYDSNNINLLQDKFEINTSGVQTASDGCIGTTSQCYTAVQVDANTTPYTGNVKGGSIYGGFANNWQTCANITGNVTGFFVNGMGTSCGASPGGVNTGGTIVVSSSCPFCSVVPSGISQPGTTSSQGVNMYKMMACNNGQGDCLLLKNNGASDPGAVGDCVALLTNDNAGRDCPITATGVQVGVVASLNGVANNLFEVQVNGVATVNLDATVSAVVGDFVCVGTTTLGLAHENSTTACTAGKQLGIVAHTTTTLATVPIWIQIK